MSIEDTIKFNNEFNMILCRIQTNFGSPKSIDRIWDDVKREIKARNNKNCETSKLRHLIKGRHLVFLDNVDIYFTRREAIDNGIFFKR